MLQNNLWTETYDAQCIVLIWIQKENPKYETVKLKLSLCIIRIQNRGKQRPYVTP